MISGKHRGRILNAGEGGGGVKRGTRRQEIAGLGGRGREGAGRYDNPMRSLNF